MASALTSARLVHTFLLVQPFRNHFIYSFFRHLPTQVRAHLRNAFPDFLDLLAGWTAGEFHQLLACFFTPRRGNQHSQSNATSNTDQKLQHESPPVAITVEMHGRAVILPD
jgi:hypothetical protein